MDKIIITVEEISDNGETRKIILEEDYDGFAGSIAEMFRSIMFWLTFVPGTIDATVADKESVELDVENKFQELVNKDFNETTN